MDLTSEARSIKRDHNKIAALEKKVDELLSSRAAKLNRYQEEWDRVFKVKLNDTGRTWCSYCGLLIYKEKAQERWDLYSKSDNYGPVFAHTATKYRACSMCAEKLRSPKEAKNFDAMFEYDSTDYMPTSPNDVETQAVELLDMPPRNPLGVADYT